jgi:hypothetical protein
MGDSTISLLEFSALVALLIDIYWESPELPGLSRVSSSRDAWWGE